MGNPRTRGKIAHSEWPKIAARVATGESFAAVARSYQCTGPAIRYIVGRTHTGRQNLVADHGAKRRPVEALPPVENWQETSRPWSNAEGNAGFDRTLWSRVNGDIAAFLSAVDALMVEHTAENERALLLATDQLLRATARTRLGLEEMIARYEPTRK